MGEICFLVYLLLVIFCRFPINTGSFCFDKFPQRLNPKRTYEPHKVPEEYLRRGNGDKASTDSSSRKASASGAEGDGCKVEAKTEELDDKRKIDKKDELHRFQMEEDKVSSE
jgi:hypothetical protein